VLDTVRVPPATRIRSVQAGMDMPNVPGFVLLRMTFTKADVGTFVVHCHIGEHVDNGMMQKITVRE
jgi:FtsP/CotA-like multicopper oxidase with cupredoxin domain